MADICSMTGFASHRKTLPQGELAIDLKTVNSRFLEIHVRLPDTLRHLEVRLRQILQQHISRGKVDLYITLELCPASNLRLSRAKLAPLLADLQDLQAQYPNAGLDLGALMLIPGVLDSGQIENNELAAQVQEALEECLVQLMDHRRHEGRRLAEAITARLTAIAALLDGIEQQLGSLVTRERERLRMRCAQLQLNVDPERLEQEIALAAQKNDIAEEYDRLRAHVSTTQRMLASGGSCGKKLDFMMQEFNREANTMAAKASTLELTQCAVELKVLIEQMREQVQNLD